MSGASASSTRSMSGSSTLNAASAPAGLDVLATDMANHAVLERGLQRS